MQLLDDVLQMSELKKRNERSRKEYFDLRMTAEQEVIMLRQELVAVRKSLQTSEAECETLRQLISKEVRDVIQMKPSVSRCDSLSLKRYVTSFS